jgi:hypothetical protein
LAGKPEEAVEHLTKAILVNLNNHVYGTKRYDTKAIYTTFLNPAVHREHPCVGFESTPKAKARSCCMN